MREDMGLFRGKRLDNGEWREGYLYHNGRKWFIVTNEDMPNEPLIEMPVYVEVDPATVGEYTGLKDKNGVRMWEGNIVAGMFRFGRPLNVVVAFRDGAFGFEWHRKDIGGNDIKTFAAFTSMCNLEYEVIGDVVDNPELLEV